MGKSAELFAAIRAGNTDAFQALLDADPALATTKNEHGQSPVLFAAYNGRTEIHDLLIARGVTLELHEATAAGHLDRVKQMVEKNPELAKSCSPDGFPVFALAAAFGHLLIAQYLFEKGADVNAAATNGTSYNALTGAITGGHANLVVWLLEEGADPNYRYGPGYSPLLAAAANGHLEIAKALLQHGANLHAKTNDGKNPAALAEERKHAKVAAFLRTRGPA